jgi:AcrR family transcriptional regulator
MTEAGLRERKKQRTRGALIDAAFTLFDRKGFDATTIDEIADAVDVSPRTFFRYFASKEEVALSLLDEQIDVLVDVLATRPADEPVLTALHQAFVEVVHGCETGANGFDTDRYETMQRLVATSPALAAHGIELGAVRMVEIARLIGIRMGVDHTTDPRPQLVASVGVCAVQNAINSWQAGARGAEGHPRHSELVDTAFRLLTDGINYPAAPRT